MDVYAIRQKSTGHFMPEEGEFTRTRCEPRKYCVPRLFMATRDAQVALTWWLKGIARISYTNDPEWGHREADGIECSVQQHRKADDMEIVPMTLEEA